MAFQPIDFSRLQNQSNFSGIGDAVQNYYATKKSLAESDMYRQHGDLYRAQIPGEQAKAQKQQLINNLLTSLLGGQGQQMQPPGVMTDPTANDPFAQDVSQMLGGQGQGGMQQGGMPNMMQGGQGQGRTNPLVSGILSHELGLEKPYHILNQDNELVTYDPLSGQVSTQPTGRSPEALKRAEVKNVKEEERLQDWKTKALAEYMTEESKQPILNELMGVVNDPRFMQATGKYQSIIQAIKPDANVQELKGQFNLYTGELVNRASSVFGSTLTQGMYNTMRKVKANESDEPMANKAKVLMTNLMSRENLQYQRALYNNLEKNMSPIDASEQARASVNSQEIKDFLYTENKAQNISKKMKIDYEQLMRNAYRASEALGIPVGEVLNNFEKGNK